MYLAAFYKVQAQGNLAGFMDHHTSNSFYFLTAWYSNSSTILFTKFKQGGIPTWNCNTSETPHWDWCSL